MKNFEVNFIEEETGDIEINIDEVMKFINENKSKILSEERMVFTDFENKGFHIVVFSNKFSKTDDNERHLAYLYGIDSDNISTNFQDEKKCINISKLLQQ